MIFLKTSLGCGFYIHMQVNIFFKFGTIVFVNLFTSLYALGENSSKIEAVAVDPGFSTRDQYIVIGCVIGLTLGLIIALLVQCCIKSHVKSKQKSVMEKDYNSLDKVLPNEFPNGNQSIDRKLAKSAQMYHYQLSKQNLIELEKTESENQEKGKEHGESDSNDECMVYECHGLGKMQNVEIRNPLFDDSNSTPAETKTLTKDEGVDLQK